LHSSSQPFVFTWPKPFDLGVETCENPVDIALVLDRSTSMRSEKKDPPEPFSTVKIVAENFIHALSGGDQVGVFSFGSQATKEADLSFDTTKAITAVDALSLGTTTQETNIGGGLNLALETLLSSAARPDAKKVIILLTDGVPTEPRMPGQADYPRIYAESVARTIITQGITVYTIGLGSGVNEGFLKTIASDVKNYFFA